MTHAPTTTIRRVNPRRPYVIAASGLRRITSGAFGVLQTNDGNATDGPLDSEPVAANADRAERNALRKPLRLDMTSRATRQVVLVALHSERGALGEHARQTIAAAALLADANTEVLLLVFGSLLDHVAQGIDEWGVDRYLVLPDCDAGRFDPHAKLQYLSAAMAAFLPTRLFTPDNASGDGDLGRRYAAQSGLPCATHVVQIDAQWVDSYAQARRAYARRALPAVVLLAEGAVDTRLPFVGKGERIDPATLAAAAAAHVTMAAPQLANDKANAPALFCDNGIEDPDAAQLALEEADFIIGAGNGVSDHAGFHALATVLGAAVGASRVAVDNGAFRRDQQIGATGKTVQSTVYIAFGISGAVQHLQGIKDCRHVIAVNADVSAPIAKRADLTVVADSAGITTALCELVMAARARPSEGAAA